MNEYQDQAVWWDLQWRTPVGVWVTISDHDSGDEAEGRARDLRIDESEWRIVRRTGLA